MRPAAALLLLLLPIAAPQAEECANEDGLCELDVQQVRDVLSAAMKCQNIRQLHAAVVHAGSQLHEFRLQINDSNEVVDIDDEKLLVMASLSKGMLGTALASIQEFVRQRRGDPKFDLLKTPLRRIFGDDFWFVDEVRTQLVNLEDLLSHSTGLARHDPLWYLLGVSTKEEVMKYTCRLPAHSGFRQSFEYNNLVWTVADLALQRLTGMNYTEYMRTFLWRPLGMNDTFSSSEIDDKLRRRISTNSFFKVVGMPIDTTKLQSSTKLVEAAGGIVVSLTDLIKYMQNLTALNYTSMKRLPMQFVPVNGHASETGFGAFVNRELYHESVENFPDHEIESYSKGWFRTWYRNNLVYNHGGSLFGVRCAMDIFLKRQLGVFVHTNLGGSEGAIFQAFYAPVLNKYIADLLLIGKSFMTKENACSLFNPLASDIVPVPLRTLDSSQVRACTGKFSNFGFRTVTLYWNSSSERINAVYGISKFELLPINSSASNDRVFEFLLQLLEPLNDRAVGLDIVNQTSTHVFLRSPTVRVGQLLASIFVEANETRLISGAYEASTPLRKGLDPNSWRRPRPCAGARATNCLLCLAACLATCLATRLFVRAPMEF